MTSPDSSSEAKSTTLMENYNNNNQNSGSGGSSESHDNNQMRYHTHPQTLANPNPKSKSRKRDASRDLIDGSGTTQDEEVRDGGGDAEVWKSFSDGFGQVQAVLNRNRVLIQQVNENHRSKIADNMVKNVALIQEINGNISKVVSLYSELSSDFSNVFHHRNAGGSAIRLDSDGKSGV